MVHNIDAIFDNGVLRPIEPLTLPEGARVHLRVEEANGGQDNSTDYDTWIEGLSGRWQGEFTRNNEGTFENREPLS
jgi:predicted DNA-binding antitoxin AbrB/MazE fold protein